MINILIVDDELNILLGLRKLINWTALGYEEPSLFTNPFEALEAIRHADYDVLLTDIRMPEMSGLQLIEEARKIKKEIRVIILSSYSDYEYMHKALLEKAENYLLKPVCEGELTETLRMLATSATATTNPVNRLNESYSKIYDSLNEVFDETLSKIKTAVFEVSTDTIHSELFCLDKSIRKICSFTLAKTIIVDHYNHLLYEVQKTMAQTLMLKNDAMGFDFILSSYDSLAELTEAVICSVDSMIDKCIQICTARTGTLMDTVELYIQMNFDKPLTLASVSGKYFFSPAYFSYTFSKGRDSFLTYLNKVRLRHGAMLLIETADTIAIIAGKIGYNNEKLFYKAFKNEYKCTPTQYRINAKY